jgi:hypothetical protein
MQLKSHQVNWCDFFISHVKGSDLEEKNYGGYFSNIVLKRSEYEKKSQDSSNQDTCIVSQFLGRNEIGLEGHKNMGVFMGAVGEGFF